MNEAPQLPSPVVLFDSVNPFQCNLEAFLTRWKIRYIKARHFAELSENWEENEEPPIAMAIIDEYQHGIEFLRSMMRYNNAVQRVMLTSLASMSLFERAINKAHVNYFIRLPLREDVFLLYLRKAHRRFKDVIRPVKKFESLSLVTEDLLHDIEHYRLQASTDSLTRLMNRRAFNHFVKRAWENYKNRQLPFSLALLDLDHFKTINDRHGHPAGDFVLREIGEMMLNNLRKNDYAFRFGGEEFAVISVDTPASQMLRFMERLLDMVRSRTFRYEDHQIRLTISAGISETVVSQSPQELIQSADDALYQAKSNGRDCAMLAESPKSQS